MRPTTSGHTYIHATTTGAKQTFSSTPSDYRAYQNAYAWCKRQGLLRAEGSLKVKQEQQRKQKLAEDRERAMAKVPTNPFDVGNQTSSPSSPSSSSKKKQVDAVDHRRYVRGLKIVGRAPAKMQTPFMKQPGECKQADELLLEDGSITYQCTYSGCYKTFSSVAGVRGHHNHHSRKRRPAVADVVTEPIAPKSVTPSEKSRLLGIAARLEGAAAALREAVEHLPALATPEILDKARKYDELRKLL